VLLHGLGEGKANYLGVAKRLSAKGMNVVLIDLRGHGCSSDKYTTYGAKEKDDVKAVLDEVDKKGLKIGDVFVFGTTLGGCVAFQYAAIDPRCKGVMAIAPYRDATTVARRIAFVLAPTMSEADFRQALAEGAKMADFDPASASAVDAAKKLTCPVLVVNALLDVTVQIDWSQAVYDAAGGPKRFIVVTPGPEQLALVMIWEDWIADRMADLAHGKLDGYKSPATQPGK
jgi:alpha-beta hydrolase superfamily lysophospholipase